MDSLVASMAAMDWIVVGGGITGSALAYELICQGFSVMLIERYAALQDATRYSYGGVAYWAGTTALMRQLGAEGLARLRDLTIELQHDIQLRELDLVLTIPAGMNPEPIAATYQHCAIPPHLVDVDTACELEPLLNPNTIAGALTVRHGHVHLGELVAAYRQAFVRRGGIVEITEVTGLLGDRPPSDRITGVMCHQQTFLADRVVVCAGAWGRRLLQASGIPVPLYFTHAELIETPPVDLNLRSLVMPAVTQRFALEAAASHADIEPLWDEPGHEPVSPILDAGAVQFLDGSLRMGQISRTLTDPNAPIAADLSEQAIRQQIAAVLPALQTLPGTWHHCLVPFSRDRLPLIGAIPHRAGIYLFSGFSNPLAIVTALARRFAHAAIGQPDELLPQLALTRFKPEKLENHA